MGIFKNASPEFIALGAQDKSGRPAVSEKESSPQHAPLFYGFFRKGTTEKIPTGTSKLIPLFGIESFDVRSPYFTHQTRLLKAVSGTGNICNVKRLIPDDAGVRSNVVIYIDVLEDDVPNYVRDSKGSYVIDPDTNANKVDADNPTIPGHRVKFIRKVLSEDVNFGLLVSEEGTMTKKDADDNDVPSTMYPFIELKAKYQGEYYNNVGFTLNSLFGEDADAGVLEANMGHSFSLGLVERKNAKTSTTIRRTLFGAPDATVSFVKDAFDPSTEAIIDIDAIFKNSWFNETDPLKDTVYTDFEDLYIYRENLSYVSKMIMGKEKAYVSYEDKTWDDGLTNNTMSWFDFLSDDQEALAEEEFLLLNILAGKSSKNINYFTMIMDKTAITKTGLGEATFNKRTPIMLGGGSDGTMSNEMFETLVSREMAKYADSNSEVMDLAINTETIFYDTGFSKELKKELVQFITIRKDTILVLSTHDAAMGKKYLSLVGARATAVSLRTTLKLAPESEFFGTGVARAVIIAGTGLLRDGSSEDRIPLTYELAIKAAKMMGASNYAWKREKLFDAAPGNILTELIDIQPKTIPDGIKPTLSADGINWAQPYNRSQFQFPTMQTVYDDDTSVLNNIYTIVALSSATRIAADAWREFTGTSSLSNAQFISAVDAYLVKRFSGIYGGVVTVIPQTIITAEDEQRGYSWKVVNKLYAQNAKTKMVYATEIYRSSDL